MGRKRKEIKQEDVLNSLLDKANKLYFKNKDCLLPPILDRDPILAANFLTKEDCERCLDLLINTYSSIGEKEQKNKLLELQLTASNLNFEWFAKFTTEVGRLATGSPYIEVPYHHEDKIPKERERFPLTLFPPIIYKSHKKKVEPLTFKVRDKDPINTWRIKYIQEQYDESDFYDGFPAWYIMSEITIYEEYNTKTHCRVKIDHINGEFIYYIAGASDKWRRIIGVPSEMDCVVASFLFKN